MIKNKKLFTLALLVFNILTSFAQQNDTLDVQRNEKGSINYLHFRPNSNRKKQNDTLFLKSILKAKNEDRFRNISEITDEFGITHKKFQHYYKGIKVENSEYLMHEKNGIIEDINGDYNYVNISTVIPSIKKFF